MEITSITGDSEAVCLSLRSAAGERRLAARRVVLATGRDGLGGPFVPELFRALDRRYCAHSSDDIDFAALRGKTVAVIGAGASAVDNAAEALEAGAARVAMLVRRPDVPRVNRGMGIGSPGMWHGFDRLTLGAALVDRAAYRRSCHSAAARLDAALLAAPEFLHRRALLAQGGCNRGSPRSPRYQPRLLAFDYLILCTGFTVDWHRRPELASLAPHVLLWRDRFQPDDRDVYDQADDPFLGRRSASSWRRCPVPLRGSNAYIALRFRPS